MFFKNAERHVMNDPRIQAIDDMVEHANYGDPPNPDILLELGKANFGSLKDSVDILEKKADDLIKYLGLGTGLVGVFLSYSVPDLRVPNVAITFAGFFFWVFALILALSIRRPAGFHYPAPVDKAILFMKEYYDGPTALKLWLALSYEKAALVHQIVGSRKGRILKWAYGLLILALTLFFANFILKSVCAGRP